MKHYLRNCGTSYLLLVYVLAFYNITMFSVIAKKVKVISPKHICHTANPKWRDEQIKHNDMVFKNLLWIIRHLHSSNMYECQIHNKALHSYLSVGNDHILF